MFGSRLRLLGGGIVVALVCGLVSAPAAAAGATTLALLAGSPDASLVTLDVSGSTLTAMAPAFDPATHRYEIAGGDDGFATVTPVATVPQATVVVESATVGYPLVSGSATVPLTRNRNDILITVTSSDTTRTVVYQVSVWRLAAPAPRVVRLSGAHSTVYGGTRMTVTLADGALPPGCDRAYQIEGVEALSNVDDRAVDPATGLTTEQVSIPPSTGLLPGVPDLLLTNTCTVPGNTVVRAVTTMRNAVTYTAGYPVVRADVPDTVTATTKITLHGTDVNGASLARAWIEDAQGGGIPLFPGGWTGNDSAVVVVIFAYGHPWYAGQGPRTLHVGYCGSDNLFDLASCTTTYTKTVNWVAPTPSQLSYTPTSGPLAGGTTIRLRGKFIASGSASLTIKVGDQTAPFVPIQLAMQPDSIEAYLSGRDIIDVTVPPGSAAGPVPITVTNSYGTAVAPAPFVYSARPVITAISPSSVANTGGSAITVQGTGFGTAGRPAVIIGGTKSPSVTRISATKLTAVVPASVATGRVDVTVSSPQGGGVSLAGSLTLTAPTTVPVITRITPASGRSGDAVTVTGTGFGATGTAGVSVDGVWAAVTASSATSLSFDVPATDTAGAKDLVVAATTGAVTRVNGFTVVPDPGITTVTPSTVASYASGPGAVITLRGAGFGAGGTVKVGTAAAVGYTATGDGTEISDVAVPLSVAGPQPILVTPTGSATALRGTVTVTAPAIRYVGSDPRRSIYDNAGPFLGDTLTGVILDVPTAGGSPMRIEGTGFGAAGTLTLGGAPVSGVTWADTVITFTAPAHEAGPVALTVAPAGSVLPATRAIAATYVATAAGQPAVVRIASVVDNSHADRNEFDAASDVSNVFTVTGSNLDGTDSGATRVVLSDGTDTFTVTPSAVTATSVTFAAPRGFAAAGWKSVQVVTDTGDDLLTNGMFYLNASPPLTVSPELGLCLRSGTTGTGPVSYTPATVTISNNAMMFGFAGTVTVGGVAVAPTGYGPQAVVFSMASLVTDLSNPWGGKAIVITPADPGLPPQTVGFACGVTPTVTTLINNSAADVTVAAGTPYTLDNTTRGIIGTFTATAPTAYEYVTAADYDLTVFDRNVRAGAPVGAGDYYVRVALSRATYANERYLPFTAAPVHLTITGTQITITPSPVGAASIVYKGQLTDADFRYTASGNTDPITKVVWEYRDTACAGQDATLGWITGLPGDVARSSTVCLGDGVTPSGWEVRVKSFEMTTSGPDRSMYYQAIRPSTQITVTPRNLTVHPGRADRVYDGTTAAGLGDPTFTGVVGDDDVGLGGPAVATFTDASPGVNKPVSFSADLALVGVSALNYHLTNPSPAVTGTINRAPVVLSLAASPASVLLTPSTPITVTPTVRDRRTRLVVDPGAHPAAVVLTSQTPSICTITGTTVTARRGGTCVIAGTEAASANYLAATAFSDDSSGTETIQITVLAAAQPLSVVADDLTVAVGDEIHPTAQISGLFDTDSIGGVEYDYYSGSTSLPGPPVDPGTYRVVPRGGTLQAVNTAAYTNPTAFLYVPGGLVITALPPVITEISPAAGLITGGTVVTVTGTRLDGVGSVQVGETTLRRGSFTVNPEGTTLTFTTPGGTDSGPVDLVLVAGTATAADVFTYTSPPAPPTRPGAPGSVVTAAGNGRATITFRPPAGDTPITGYQVTLDRGRTWRTVHAYAVSTARIAGAGGTLVVTITGLANGVIYPVMIRAVNRAGAGAPKGGRDVMPNAPRLPPIVHPRTEIAVPANPGAYRGPQRWTRARSTSRGGTDANPITSLGARQLVRGEAAAMSMLGLFEFDSAVLTGVGQAEVRLLAAHLRAARTVTCEGYADYAGQARHERTLSLQRAAIVCQALIRYGAHVRTTTRGYGGTRPVIVGGTPVSREANRRVVVFVTG